ncbi:hypothetical protein EV690_3614 [Celerinatantimonas diazotrophica]|uniref:Uncharacterized protein n=1 Tax=Celerinatantimonas diazotrophica TaxID=412034 RepID=A0A4V2PNB3_9GAMM|nr:hypothetical protein EV690_3614 [Celerinatantimonas diazotrophica]CAG9295288.1 hypothetical protein CEDIAZO_00400 [Celerinatantimonas diazotrophica]
MFLGVGLFLIDLIKNQIGNQLIDLLLPNERYHTWIIHRDKHSKRGGIGRSIKATEPHTVD